MRNRRSIGDPPPNVTDFFGRFPWSGTSSTLDRDRRLAHSPRRKARSASSRHYPFPRGKQRVNYHSRNIPAMLNALLVLQSRSVLPASRRAGVRRQHGDRGIQEDREGITSWVLCTPLDHLMGDCFPRNGTEEQPGRMGSSSTFTFL